MNQFPLANPDRCIGCEEGKFKAFYIFGEAPMQSDPDVAGEYAAPRSRMGCPTARLRPAICGPGGTQALSGLRRGVFLLARPGQAQAPCMQAVQHCSCLAGMQVSVMPPQPAQIAGIKGDAFVAWIMLFPQNESDDPAAGRAEKPTGCP
jgi:hypothetical protein